MPDDFGGWWGDDQRRTARALNSELLQSERWLGAVLPIGDGVAFAGKTTRRLTSMTTTASAQDLTLREPQTDDVEKLAQIVFDAFGSIDYHRFTETFPNVEAALGMISAWVAHPGVWVSSPSAAAGSSAPTSSTSVTRSRCGPDHDRSRLAELRRRPQVDGSGGQAWKRCGRHSAASRTRFTCDRSLSIRRWAST